MTHKLWEHGQSGHESTDYTLSVVPYVGGWLALPIDKEPMEALAGVVADAPAGASGPEVCSLSGWHERSN